MRALSVRQPWASLIVLGLKDEEYRSRPTKVRGHVLIYASSSSSYSSTEMEEMVEEISGALAEEMGLDEGGAASLRQDLGELFSARRAFLGLAEIVDCKPGEEEGEWIWVIGDTIPFEQNLYPIDPIQPGQVFWNVPDDLLVRMGERTLPLRQALQEARERHQEAGGAG